MALLVGRYTNKIDKKGRVSVPKPFRAPLAEQGFNGLYAFPSFKNASVEAGGEDFMTRVNDSLEANLDLFSEESEDLADILMGMSHALPFDPEGRIALPRELLDHADIADEALFVGKGSRVQIWEPDAFAERSRAALGRAKANGATLRLGPGAKPKPSAEDGR